MMDSLENLKIPGDSHPKQRQVCTLHQEELEIKNHSVFFSDTSAKLQDILFVLDEITLLPELKNHVQISDVSMDSMVVTTRDKGGVGAATLANNWGIGIEAAKRTRLVTNQKGIQYMIHPCFTNILTTNDRQLRYRRLHITLYTDTMYSTIKSRTENRAA
jgi:hypothetical protein